MNQQVRILRRTREMDADMRLIYESSQSITGRFSMNKASAISRTDGQGQGCAQAQVDITPRRTGVMS